MTLYNDSKRIVGTNADRIGTSAISGGWKEIGRTTLGSAGDALTVSSFADKRYYMFLYNAIPSGEMTEYLTFGSLGVKDTTAKYANRVSSNGASSGSGYNSRSNIVFSAKSGGTQPEFGVSYIANKSDRAKLLIGHCVNAHTAGAGTAPDRTEFVGKHVQTSNPLNVVSFDNTGTGDDVSGTECVVLGYDPDDAHTTNFWEQLTDKSWTNGNAITTDTFTTKKYLWIQGWYTQSGTSGHNRFRVGNGTIDTGSNYSHNYSINGGTNANGTSLDNLWSVVGQGSDAGIDRCFFNMFIINDGSKEKLITGSNVWSQTDGAGTAPERTEFACKWVDTSDQINIVEININGSGSFSGGQIKVWGSN